MEGREQVVERMRAVAAADVPFEVFLAQAVRLIARIGLAHHVADALRDGSTGAADPVGVGARRLELAIAAGVFLPDDLLV